MALTKDGIRKMCEVHFNCDTVFSKKCWLHAIEV